MSSQDISEHTFDQVVRIGYGHPIISCLHEHEASALGCVNQQSAESVRWQRENGNLVPIWSEDDKERVTLRYKNINITTDFPIENIILRESKTNKTKIKIKFYGYFTEDDVDTNDCDGDEHLYGLCYEGPSGTHRAKTITVDSADYQIYYDSLTLFKKQRLFFRQKKIEEEKKAKLIRAEEEKKRLFVLKTSFTIPASAMNRPNPWKKLPKVVAQL